MDDFVMRTPKLVTGASGEIPLESQSCSSTSQVRYPYFN